jgi:DnaJ-class molecular chaperone
MSRGEALEVLGLPEGASRDEILGSYKALMRKVHPDAPGGSTYLATKLNQAKDALLD